MFKTFRLSFSLKNTYRVNSILYSFKQIPLIRKLLPDTLYQVRELKIFANILAIAWEVLSVFIGKLLYFLIMFVGIGLLFTRVQTDRLFLHILIFLTAIGLILNNNMFNPTRDKYYAMFLLRMDAKAYTLTDFGYTIVKTVVGFFPFALLFWLVSGVPLWLSLLLPFSVAGAKLTGAACSLVHYDRTEVAGEKERGRWLLYLLLPFLLAAAYLLPAFGIALPLFVSAGLMVAVILSGAACLPRILRFGQYRTIYQQLLARSMNQMDEAEETSKQQSRRLISAESGIASSRKGIEYLNELFIKRHKKVLWRPAKRIALISLLIMSGALLAFCLLPELKRMINESLLNFLPYLVFIMYGINCGTGFTRVLFMNCDHSLLTYSFFKQPSFVLRLFRIRLRELVKVNLLPALVIGAGLAGLLFASGGTENPLNYAVLFVAVVYLSVFFSVHNLTLYYLLHPDNVGTEMKSATYQIALAVTYVVSFIAMQLEIRALIFGLLTIGFCIVYSVVACILVYKLAPRTFRLRI